MRKEMESILGVPCMLLPFSALKPWPKLLPVLCKDLKPAVDTGEFFHSAQRLQADAYTRMFNYFFIPDLHARAEEDGSARELADLVDLFQSRAALYALFFVLAGRSLEGPVGQSRSAAPVPGRPLFPQIHWRETSVSKIPQNEAVGAQNITAPAFPNPEYAALHRWPGFFASYCNSLQSLLEFPLYTDWQLSTRTLAHRLVEELPVPAELAEQRLCPGGLSEQELGSAIDGIDSLVENLVRLLLNMAVARIGLEKGSCPAGIPAAREEKFANRGRVA
jgi:hypothetical protein